MSRERFDFESWFEEEFLESREYSVRNGWGSNEVGGFEREPDFNANTKKTYLVNQGHDRTLSIQYMEETVGYSPSQILSEGRFDTGYLDHQEFEGAVERLRQQEDVTSEARTNVFEFTYVLGDGWETFVDELTDAVTDLESSPDIRLAGSEDEKLAFCYAEPSTN